MHLEELNEQQREAVFYQDGPLLILAGAGSGKTKVLTTKIAYLLQEKHVSPYSILAITFTNKAAREMKERVAHFVSEDVKKMQISTFHSFGLRILREHCEKLGYTSSFSIMDSDDSLVIIKKILKESNLDPKMYNPKAIKNKISSCKNEMILPEAYEKYAISEFEKVVLEIYQKYEKKLSQNNAVDFDDLLLLPILLFKEHPSVLQQYQERYQYILIDEYQDTNEAQYILSKMISAKYRNLCCVGDNDQAIYSFRGANYKNILNFEKDYPDAKVIKLEQNYRSTQTILEAANSVIRHNRERKEKNLFSTKEKGEKVKIYRAYDGNDEVHYVTSCIKKLHAEGTKYEDIAILYRTNAQSRVLEEVFLKEGIPHHVVGGLSFYARREIKDLLAYLRLLHNPHDNISLERAINVPKRGIGLRTLEELNQKADLENQSIYTVIDHGKPLLFKKLIQKLSKIKEEVTLTELVDKVLDASGMKAELESEKSLEAEVRLENLEEFKSITKAFEEREGLVSLEDFLYEVSLVTDKGEYDSGEGQVSLMTVHAVKGLEFDIVFVIGMEEGIFPHLNALMENQSLEEERRLCYVAITRAREKLYFLCARRRVLFGKDQVNPPSRFLSEMDENLVEKEKMEEEAKECLHQEEIFHEVPIDYQVGDFVYHENFGAGRVVEVTDTLVSVAFKHPIGVRKLMKNHKSLSKV